MKRFSTLTDNQKVKITAVAIIVLWVLVMLLTEQADYVSKMMD